MRALASLAAVLVLVLGAASAAQAQFQFPVPQPSPQAPAADTRAVRIKAGLEAKQLKVYGTGVMRGTGFMGGSEVDLFYATVAATYAQPTFDKVEVLALEVWGTMYDVLSKEPPMSILSGSQVWTKYGLVLQTRVGDITTVVSAWQAAKSDEEKKRAYQTFLESVRWRVYDYEKEQFVDQKDFVNKNFTR
jgi:hypothetical protein